MPVTFLDGQINVLTLASDRPGGFTTTELGQIYEVLGQLGRLYELHNMRRTAVTLLVRQAPEILFDGVRELDQPVLLPEPLEPVRRIAGRNIHAAVLDAVRICKDL